MNRKLLAVVAIFGGALWAPSPLQGQEKGVDPGAVQAIRSLVGVQIQEKEGQIIEIDFRKCEDLITDEVMRSVAQSKTIKRIRAALPKTKIQH